MKLFLKILFLFLLSLNLKAEVISAFMENDVVDGKDKHYTNGTSFMYLSDKDTNDYSKYNNSFFDLISKIPTFNNDTKYQTLGLTYSQFAFTPSDLEKKEKIIDDLPYAGVITLDFILYKWEEDFFHEYMMTLGAIGPSTKTDDFQKEYHKISGNKDPKGWDNQLKDDFLYNFSYSYGYRMFKQDFSYGKMDLVNNFRADIGNYNRALMAGSMLRYGNNYPNNFNTIGRFLGANENKLLNLDSKRDKKLGWSLSYGLGYSYTDYFYVNDFDKSYELEKIKDTIIQVISFDTYFDNFVITFTLKSSKFAVTNENSTRENWGGVNIAYLF
jgi:hypothetical protein